MYSRAHWLAAILIPILLAGALPGFDMGRRAYRIWKESADWNRLVQRKDGKVAVQHGGSDMWETMNETQEGRAVLKVVEKMPVPRSVRIRSVSCDNGFLKATAPPVPRSPAYQLPTKLTPELLARPAANLKDVLLIVKTTQVGTETMAPIERAIEAGSIRLEDYEKGPLTKDKLPESHAYVDLSTGRIYLDTKQQTGLLALYLFHELVHLTDRNSQRAIGIRDKLRMNAIMEAETVIRRVSWRKLKERGQLLPDDFSADELSTFAGLKWMTDEVCATEAFRAEAYALARGNQFGRELTALYPGYYRHVQVGLTKDDISHQELDPKQLINEMRLPKDMLTKWIDGNCIEL